jgi:hypothetical protein
LSAVWILSELSLLPFLDIGDLDDGRNERAVGALDRHCVREAAPRQQPVERLHRQRPIEERQKLTEQQLTVAHPEQSDTAAVASTMKPNRSVTIQTFARASNLIIGGFPSSQLNALGGYGAP